MSSASIELLREKVGVLGKIYSSAAFVYEQLFGSAKSANETYKVLQPLLEPASMRYGRDSEEFTNLLDKIAELAPCGAVRRNFRRKYVENKHGWKELPADPDVIMFGYWW
ncbi:hypothetical protein [Bowmanella pacifica]|uniref:Uncharacterized protein n=1 Tax=Bowmanella pacifica TaxID=502051 RepID=A0A917YUT6_9ALTE|nr:hypothetical protein [Bowmanella pacifica]GGO67283.1 hypothetical protein GCM10010982_13370 [Bowmanella pacifica]